MTDRTPSSEELLDIYHDLWDLKLRASQLGRSFLGYLLELALEDVHQDLSQHRLSDQQHNPSGQAPGL